SAGSPCTSASSGKKLALYQVVTAALSTNGSIQDNREQATVRTATLDIGALSSAIAANTNLSTFNGIVYIADTSASTSAKRGIKLTNGGVISQDVGLTISSANPVYVQGDYNT